MSLIPPLTTADPTTAAWQSQAVINPHGFREYDVRWQFEKDINLTGLQYIGMGLGTQLTRRYPDRTPRVVVGHDYRAYSQSVKQAITIGLLATGCDVIDIGLALSPTAYFAQMTLEAEGVAMITASHNPNGWTGVKMGLQPLLTHGPQEVRELKEIVLSADFDTHPAGGQVTLAPDWGQKYIDDLAGRVTLTQPLKVVLACGNGTAGAFAPQVLEKIGAKVIPLHCSLDHTFPHHNPNPENEAFMAELADTVKKEGADVGLAFDGDGDRIGLVDETGTRLYNDKAGLILARYLSAQHPESHFVVDVKSTGLFGIDAVLEKNKCSTEYWITGHSYIKRRVHEKQALAGFEKSGHFFLNAPIGHLYDDALAVAVLMVDVLQKEGKTLNQLLSELPITHQAPTAHPTCADDQKYDVVEAIQKQYKEAHEKGETIAGQTIKEVITVNGTRVVLADGTWGLVRASSNVPALVVTGESPSSPQATTDMLADIQTRLDAFPEVGPDEPH